MRLHDHRSTLLAYVIYVGAFVLICVSEYVCFWLTCWQSAAALRRRAHPVLKEVECICKCCFDCVCDCQCCTK